MQQQKYELYRMKDARHRTQLIWSELGYTYDLHILPLIYMRILIVFSIFFWDFIIIYTDLISICVIINYILKICFTQNSKFIGFFHGCFVIEKSTLILIFANVRNIEENNQHFVCLRTRLFSESKTKQYQFWYKT